MGERRLIDQVKAELIAVSRSATSKREEAANLALIWNGRGADVRWGRVRQGRHRLSANAPSDGTLPDHRTSATA